MSVRFANRAAVTGVIASLAVTALSAQRGPPSVASADSVTLVAGAGYRASGFHRWLLGGVYRTLWVTPIRVPVLNLKTFAGGLTADKAGGGKQTKSLRLIGADGVEYVFRSVDKDDAALPPSLRDIGLAKWLARDQTSSSHPAAHLVAAPLLKAAGVIHEAPQLVAMPDDPALGEFRADFAHRLGIIMPFPTEGKDGAPRFADALEIIDSDTLLQRLNRDPSQRVDERAYLTARLVDMLSNNYDRHPGNWKWARLSAAPEAPWFPISRDQDKVLIGLDGVLPRLFRRASPSLISFGPHYPAIRSLTSNSLALDQRLLAGLEWLDWDSVARATQARLTDAVIAGALAAMPAEYAASAPVAISALRIRRDSLPMIARRFYLELSRVLDIHATDAAEVATLTHAADGSVEVRLATVDGRTWYQRHFVTEETTSLRLYLHGGDDLVTMTGEPVGIPLIVVGGEGRNTITGSAADMRLRDFGAPHAVKYGGDTLWSRRPRVAQAGGSVAPGRDAGANVSPTAAISVNRDLGIMPSLGVRWRGYGFRRVPYGSQVALLARHSFKTGGSLVSLTGDLRRESSSVRFTALAQMSQLELVNYHGLGNSSRQTVGILPGASAPREDYFAVAQRQWRAQPALVIGVGSASVVEFGPVVQFTRTDATPDRFITDSAPYGSGDFGQVSARLAYRHDTRAPSRHPDGGSVVEAAAAYSPALWDARAAFGSVGATATMYRRLPVPTHPVLRVRGGAKKVFGDFPYLEAAFLGGRNDLRALDLQRYAGDASINAGLELRIPVARVPLILPWRVGLLATGDIGRVYLHGASPGRWHDAYGAGFSIGLHDLALDVRLLRANEPGQSAVVTFRLASLGILP